MTFLKKSWNDQIKYLIPPMLLDYMRKARAYPKYLQNKNVLKTNNVWLDKFKGQSVYILGNGPSLQAITPTIFKNKNIIVMNNFYKCDWSHTVTPIAVCFGEPPSSPSWEDPIDIFSKTPAESYWLHIDNASRLSRDGVSPKLNFVCPGVEPSLYGRKKIDLASMSIGYQNTGILALEIALYMGFSEIKLLGYDHDWLASPDYSRHFYSSEKEDTDLIGTMAYIDLIYSAARTWEGYYALKRASIYHGSVIVNCSSHSFLDVFPRRKENSKQDTLLD